MNLRKPSSPRRRGSSPPTPHWIFALETVDFLRVGVAAALVAAVRDEPERGQAPRLRRARDGTRFALVPLSCRHRFSTVSFAGMTEANHSTDRECRFMGSLSKDERGKPSSSNG